MMQSAKNGLRLDSPKSLNSTLNGCILAQGQVRAGCIVIIHVGRQHVAQVLLAEHDDMVETLLADRADQALRIAILPRRAWRCRMIPNAERADATDEDIAVATIAITDQITRDLLPTTCFSQLVGDPLCRGVCGDAEPHSGQAKSRVSGS
jgi:hypothetical protein